jgi:hypothetical protein
MDCMLEFLGVRPETIDGAMATADRFNRLFLRTLRKLRDLRRYSVPVTINNPAQFNISEGGQQVKCRKGRGVNDDRPPDTQPKRRLAGTQNEYSRCRKSETLSSEQHSLPATSIPKDLESLVSNMIYEVLGCDHFLTKRIS